MTQPETMAGDPHLVEARPPSKAFGLLLGLGKGALIDGIVLHQILQWHHMVSDEESTETVSGLEANTLADGFFHVAGFILVLAGTFAMHHAWRQGRIAPNLKFHIGLLLLGWGIFNVVEGVVNHQVLGVHHVRDDLGGPLSWDLGFLVFGVLLIIGGWLLHKRGEADLTRRRGHQA